MHTQLLRKISKDISTGNALWALFWANEYLEKENPLRKALVTKTRESVDCKRHQERLFQLGVEGKTVASLTSTDLEQLKNFDIQEQKTSLSQKVTVMPRKRWQRSARRPILALCRRDAELQRGNSVRMNAFAANG